MIRKTAALLLVLVPVLTRAGDIVEVRAEDVHAALIASPKGFVVDARTPQEFDQAHIPGAISIPADRVKAEASRLPHDKATPIIFYCRGPG